MQGKVRVEAKWFGDGGKQEQARGPAERCRPFWRYLPFTCWQR